MTKIQMLATAVILLVMGAMIACNHVPPPVDTAETDNHSPLLDFYRGPLNHLSAVRRGSCPSYPSCSEYSRQAIAKHGPVIGGMMTMDRLMRCGRDETKSAPLVLVNGRWRYYDPLENNDFWLGGHGQPPKKR